MTFSYEGMEKSHTGRIFAWNLVYMDRKFLNDAESNALVI